MDINKLVEVLRGTLQPEQREEAEKHLMEVHKIIGFVPALLQLVMSEQLDMPVRQAGVVYMKNMISQYWEENDEAQTSTTEPAAFVIHENDKQLVRDHLVEAVIAASNPVRVQLAVCVSHVVKRDFPAKWPGVAEKILGYLKSDRQDTWLGALVCLYTLVKHFEYKKAEERKSLNDVMVHLLPLIHQICMQLLADQSEMSVTIQKHILKVFFALVQFHLPLELVTQPVFTSWMELARQIADRPVPEECNQVDEDERPELIWWKCKKWSLHILTRCFERYGSPGTVMKEYKEFAEWFLRTFSAGILEVMFHQLESYRNKQYMTPRALQLILTYLTQSVNHALSWKLMKPHMQVLVQDIVFPLMCHTDEDEELWESDPIEYIRVKYDVYEEFFNPAMAAQTLLHAAAGKRREVLQKAMGFIVQVLTSQNLDPRHKSGALHMVGALAEVLLQKKIYKEQAELMMVNHVFPEFISEHRFLRARSCWVVNSFSEVKFKNVNNLKTALDVMRNILSNDREIPVRIEAAMALQQLLAEQEKAHDMLKPHIRQITIDLLTLIRETENDDLASVLQKFVCEYSEDITPLAVEITTHLAQTFAKVLESSNEATASEDKSMTAMGILNTLESICSIMENQADIMAHIEGVVIDVIGVILLHNVQEFFEEMLSLVYSLTSQRISARMWQTLPLIYELFNKDNVEYFTDMMPALHNYITVDPQAFLAEPKHMEMIFTMCKTVLTSDAGEDAECHAAKLLEVILLQYKGLVDQVVPMFVQLALERLMREILTTELRTMCLQVVVAALYYNPPMLLELLAKPLPNSTDGSTILAHFFKQWLNDADCFLGLHDRKIFVLGLCTLLSMTGGRPQVMTDEAARILPSLIIVFKGLKRAYEYRSKEDADSEDGDEDEDGENDLDDEEDVIDDESEQYLARLEKADDSDDDDDDDGAAEEETALESYDTPLDKEDCTVDEYQVFKAVLEGLQTADPAWYQLLVSQLTDEHKKDLDEVFRLAEQKKAATESKRIEQAGGYVFSNMSVPASFNFGGGAAM